jgi:hypothetical protein
MKSPRLALAFTVASLLTSGCLFGDDPAPKESPGNVVDPGGEPPATPGNTATNPDPNSPTSSVPAAPAPTSDKPAATSPTSTMSAPAPRAPGAERNVIKGVVRDEQGDPVQGARIRILGYTGNPNGLSGADYIKDAVTDAQGAYRLAVPAGLYGVSGAVDVAFDGKTYKSLYLHPADGNCEKQMSEGGIVKDFVFRLTGLMKCLTNPDPKNEGSYSGASVLLSHQSPKSLPGDARLTLTLTPTGPLADGSAGKPLTFTRTAAALVNFAGPLETTNILHDIPLGRYRLTGFATLPSGSRQDLRFGPWNTNGAAESPVADYTVSFPVKAETSSGIKQAEIAVYDAGWSGSTPSPHATAPVTTAPTTTPTTARPTTPSTCYSEYVGPIPC